MSRETRHTYNDYDPLASSDEAWLDLFVAEAEHSLVWISPAHHSKAKMQAAYESRSWVHYEVDLRSVANKQSAVRAFATGLGWNFDYAPDYNSLTRYITEVFSDDESDQRVCILVDARGMIYWRDSMGVVSSLLHNIDHVRQANGKVFDSGPCNWVLTVLWYCEHDRFPEWDIDIRGTIIRPIAKPPRST